MKSALALTFHGISNRKNSKNRPINKLADRYWVSKKKFCSILDHLHPKKCCTTSEFIKKRVGNYVILTFDDGNISDFELVFPLMVEKGICATFFVTAGNIGKDGYTSATQLREMAEAGMEIASHGCIHQYLVSMTKQLAENEICKSKEKIEDQVGAAVSAFAPVGGHYKNWMIQTAFQTGYKLFATMIPGKSKIIDELIVLKRNHIQRNNDLNYVISLLNCDRNLLIWNRLSYEILRLPKTVLGMQRYDKLKRIL